MRKALGTVANNLNFNQDTPRVDDNLSHHHSQETKQIINSCFEILHFTKKQFDYLREGLNLENVISGTHPDLNRGYSTGLQYSVKFT